ncbi:MAG: diguanylate cyclase [Nitrospiraceae bacterium]|nr:diguanylate cyclase [Nitrospiraceae bacterium]
MRRLVTAGLIVYTFLAAAGLFLESGISSSWFFPWVAGYLFLLLWCTYDFVFTGTPLYPLPFSFIVLGVVLLNFVIQLAGETHASLWPAYFVLAVVFSSLSRLPQALSMVLLVIAIESANLYVGRQFDPAQWDKYAGYPVALAGVSMATSSIIRQRLREEDRVRDAHERLIKGADAVDPFAVTGELQSLSTDHRRAVHLQSVQQREITFNGLIDMIYGFVPAHTYALFLREFRDETDVYTLRAIRTESPDAVLPLGALPDESGRKLIVICADQRQTQNISDLTALGTPLDNLGYYRGDARLPAVRSLLMLPIVNNDQAIAVLAVDSLEPGAFSDENQDMLNNFAPFFVQIIENTSLTLKLKARADHFSALHEISTDLNNSLKFGEIMSTVIPKIQSVVPFDFGACVLATEAEGGQNLQFVGLHGYDKSFLGKTFPLEASAIMVHMHKHWTEQRIGKYYTSDFGSRGRDIGLFPFKELQRPLRSMYGRLLVTNNNFLGAVFLSSLKPAAFSEYQRDSLLDTLLNQISLVAANAKLFEQIENMARCDGLTGLLNHRTFMEKLAERYKELERTPRPFSILLMDIDKFKGVNDKYGHPVGDLAIKAVAKVLRETVRATDFVARYGGEEFAVGMIETDAKGAGLIAERIRAVMEQTVAARVFDGELKITLSIGVAAFPEDTENRDILVACADEALYHAKRNGRNRVCFHREAAAAAAPPAAKV